MRIDGVDNTSCSRTRMCDILICIHGAHLMLAFGETPAVCPRPPPDTEKEEVGSLFLHASFHLLHFRLHASVRSTSFPVYVLLVLRFTYY